MREKRQEIEDAITTLKEILANEEASEAEFQAWFESHPVIFTALGYKSHRSHPALPIGEEVNGGGIPDFLTENLSGIWDIFELKLPGTRILKDSDRRQTFYAELESCLQQCVDYSKYFNDGANRDAFEKRNGFRISGRPLAKLVAGRNDGLDRSKVRDRLADRNNAVDLITYDEVYERLEFFKAKTLVKYEGLTGFSLHVTLHIEQAHGAQRNQILMIGAQPRRNCISIYINEEGEFVLELIDSRERIHCSRVADAQTLFAPGVPSYCIFEFGRGDGYSITSIEVGNRCHSFNLLDEFAVNLTDPIPIIVGADTTRGHNSNFDLYELLMASHTLDLSGREAIRRNTMERYTTDSFNDTPQTRFRGAHFMRSNAHPKFTFDRSHRPGDLIQPDRDTQPVWFHPKSGKSARMVVFNDQTAK